MRYSQFIAPLLGVCFAALLASCATGGGDSSMSRSQAKADRDAFLATHEWDEMQGNWVAKPGTAAVPTAPSLSRAEVKAQRDEYLKTHTFDEMCICWKDIGPRDLSTMSRDQVKAETAEFMRTHTFDEATGKWVMKK